MQIVRKPTDWSRVGLSFWVCYEPMDLLFELQAASDLDPADPWCPDFYTARAYSPRAHPVPPPEVLDPLTEEAVLMILLHEGKLKLVDVTAPQEGMRACA